MKSDKTTDATSIPADPDALIAEMTPLVGGRWAVAGILAGDLRSFIGLDDSMGEEEADREAERLEDLGAECRARAAEERGDHEQARGRRENRRLEKIRSAEHIEELIRTGPARRAEYLARQAARETADQLNGMINALTCEFAGIFGGGPCGGSELVSRLADLVLEEYRTWDVVTPEELAAHEERLAAMKTRAAELAEDDATPAEALEAVA